MSPHTAPHAGNFVNLPDWISLHRSSTYKHLWSNAVQPYDKEGRTDEQKGSHDSHCFCLLVKPTQACWLAIVFEVRRIMYIEDVTRMATSIWQPLVNLRRAVTE